MYCGRNVFLGALWNDGNRLGTIFFFCVRKSLFVPLFVDRVSYKYMVFPITFTFWLFEMRAVHRVFSFFPTTRSFSKPKPNLLLDTLVVPIFLQFYTRKQWEIYLWGFQTGVSHFLLTNEIGLTLTSDRLFTGVGVRFWVKLRYLPILNFSVSQRFIFSRNLSQPPTLQ